MTQIAFPVLARTAGTDELFALRRRMVRLLTVVLFPLLALLVILAPVVVPWLFGPAWEPAVLPTQILAGGGAATIVIDAVGSALMARAAPARCSATASRTSPSTSARCSSRSAAA